MIGGGCRFSKTKRILRDITFKYTRAGVEGKTFCKNTHTLRKEPFWFFKKTQRKISKNTLRRANCLALQESYLAIAFSTSEGQMVVCKRRLSTSKGQFIWLSRRFKLIAMLLDRDCLALLRVNLKVDSSVQLFFIALFLFCV